MSNEFNVSMAENLAKFFEREPAAGPSENEPETKEKERPSLAQVFLASAGLSGHKVKDLTAGATWLENFVASLDGERND